MHAATQANKTSRSTAGDGGDGCYAAPVGSRE
jgi:hypothetical protein